MNNQSLYFVSVGSVLLRKLILVSVTIYNFYWQHPYLLITSLLHHLLFDCNSFFGNHGIDLGNVSASQQYVLSLMFVQFRPRKFSDSGFKCFMNK